MVTQKPASLIALEHEDVIGTSGDGREAWEELQDTYLKVALGRPRQHSGGCPTAEDLETFDGVGEVVSVAVESPHLHTHKDTRSRTLACGTILHSSR